MALQHSDVAENNKLQSQNPSYLTLPMFSHHSSVYLPCGNDPLVSEETWSLSGYLADPEMERSLERLEDSRSQILPIQSEGA